MIKKIEIKNFKSIQHLVINCNNRFNVLIGTNNIGKTSIFEAIHLWKMCYALNIKKDKQGFYATSRNLPFRDLEFIRVYNDMDLYPASCKVKDATIEITLVLTYQDTDYTMGFTITKVSSIDDAYLQVSYIDATEFQRFSDMVKANSKKLDTFVTINETRPVANIIAKEPYMYKAQVMDKIAKGKGYEVLRNQLRENTEVVQAHINNILQAEHHIAEVDRDNKDYITMRVDGKNILSFGSGFLQLADIFSSIEYLDSEIGILLVDEPDAHLHLKMQKRLLDEFRTLDRMQLFIITHNERFLEYVDESQILFIDEVAKQNGTVVPLASGCKGIVLENLIGCLERREQLTFARKLVLVEGQGDLDFLNKMFPKYLEFSGLNQQNNVFIKMEGIDTLNAKLISYARALKGLIPSDCKWLIIRDTDCVPISKKVTAGNDDKKNVDVSDGSISVIFQDGYGIESTFLSDIEKFVKLICKYYALEEDDYESIKAIVLELNNTYTSQVQNLTTNIYKEWKGHFDRQIKNRSGRVYDNLTPEATLREISPTTVQYIMTKNIMDWYLRDIHNRITAQFPGRTQSKLTRTSIFDAYYNQIACLDDFFDAHKTIMDAIYN